MADPLDLDQIVRQAAEQKIAELQAQIDEIRRRYLGRTPVITPSASPAARKRPPMTPAAKRALSQKMKALWAKKKKAQGSKP